MRGELVFTVHPGTATLAKRVTLAEAGLKERSDLQEWIRAHPNILGEGVRIVTYEFDHWFSDAGTHNDRLDLLGLDPGGRLVLAELKRDGAPDTVEMQAIKYAAYASRFTIETLASCHGAYLRKTGDSTMTDEDALTALDEHCGGLDPDLLASPRIVLVAGAFPQSVTASVVWLCEQGLDITLTQIGAYQSENDLVVTVSQLWPIPDVGDFTISPSAPARTAAATRTRSPRTAASIIIDQELIDDGTVLTLKLPQRLATGTAVWLMAHPDAARARWFNDDRRRVLEWEFDHNRYSLSGLSEHIVLEATGEQVSLNGAEYWFLPDGTTPAELGGFSVGTRDWTSLHAVLSKVKPGEWTTYGDLAGVVGTHPNPLGQHLAKCAECTNAWRVLGADGKPRPAFTWTDPTDKRTCRDVLEDEGVEFDAAGSADPATRIGPKELSALLGS